VPSSDPLEDLVALPVPLPPTSRDVCPMLHRSREMLGAHFCFREPVGASQIFFLYFMPEAQYGGGSWPPRTCRPAPTSLTRTMIAADGAPRRGPRIAARSIVCCTDIRVTSAAPATRARARSFVPNGRRVHELRLANRRVPCASARTATIGPRSEFRQVAHASLLQTRQSGRALSGGSRGSTSRFGQGTVLGQEVRCRRYRS